MKQKQFRIILFLIVMLMGAVSSFAFSIGSPTLAISVFLAGITVTYLLKSKMEGIVEDERIHQISQKASWITFQIVVISFALGGTTLIAMRNSYPGYNNVGFFMVYVSCAIMVLYSLLYMHYNREYGG
ncbi:hypothetical protein MSBRW_0311 [Methanosarcina barkeri str. Wiesmoor]|uniref:DUF2178 domain-containing protein n=2 Tax=Methanosarcina barkeri TaxID=2208 RepID=A0A0E3QGB6_METBA|nr:DUF2178 domain-containing protein [Methanosarcina barkeri]AKB49564.1 hypothetical protein MSBRW_0311 [Methanosarcina barkeri str. Wiesmoor]